MSVQTLYRFFNTEGRLLYVGITSMLVFHRLEGHRHESPWWTQVTTITVEHYDTRDEVAAAEVKAIIAEGPLFNVLDNPLCAQPRRRHVRVPRLQDVARPKVLERDAWGVLRRTGTCTTDSEVRRYIKRAFGYDHRNHMATVDRCPWYDVRRDQSGSATRRLVRFAIAHGVRPDDDGPLGRLVGVYAMYLLTEWLVDLGMMGVGPGVVYRSQVAP